MNSPKSLLLVACLLWANVSAATELTFLSPDGRPAAGTKVYRTFANPRSTPMGSGMDMDMGMGMGMEMMGGMGNDYGEMGMAGGYGMDDEMMMGGVSSSAPSKSPVFSFLNGMSLQPRNPQIGNELTCGDDGRVSLNENLLSRARGNLVHSYALMAVHDSGVSFIPAGTTFTPEVRLRSRGQITVVPPAGVDASKYLVLACWQNGFAYPGLDEYTKQPGPTPGRNVNTFDWRFKPYFRWFQTAPLGKPLSVPPGEIRVTIIPVASDTISGGKDYVDGDALFQSLISGGPSTLALVSGKSETPVSVEFPPLRSLEFRVPTQNSDSLPNWGDESPGRYYLESFKRILVNSEEMRFGDTPMLTTPPNQVLSSTSSCAAFLNKQRSERAEFQAMRLPSSSQYDSKSDVRTVRFDLLRPGWYVLMRANGDGMETRGIPMTDWQHEDDVSTATVAIDKDQGGYKTFHLAVSDQGTTKFEPADPVKAPVTKKPATKKSDAKKLELIRSLRKEIEATMARMATHCQKLMQLETQLQGGQTSLDPFADPFGDGTTTALDPFGNPIDPLAPSLHGNPFDD